MVAALATWVAWVAWAAWVGAMALVAAAAWVPCLVGRATEISGRAACGNGEGTSWDTLGSLTVPLLLYYDAGQLFF